MEPRQSCPAGWRRSGRGCGRRNICWRQGQEPRHPQACPKRGVIGTYHHLSEAHVGRYTAEFDFRYNTRKLNDHERSDLALQGWRPPVLVGEAEGACCPRVAPPSDPPAAALLPQRGRILVSIFLQPHMWLSDQVPFSFCRGEPCLLLNTLLSAALKRQRSRIRSGMTRGCGWGTGWWRFEVPTP